MSTLDRTRIRLAGDAVCFDAPLEQTRRATPQFWRGNDVQFEIAVLSNGALMDVSNLASATLEIRPLAADGGAPTSDLTPLMGATVTEFDNTTDLTSWTNGAKQHAVIAFTAAESSIAAGPAWLSLFVITQDDPGRVVTLCAGPVRVLEGGSGVAMTPQPAAQTYYTAAQADARFAPLGAGGEGGAPASDDNPLMNGTVSPGTASTYSRGDHRHPTDTSRAPLASPAFTGTVVAPTVSTATDSSTKVATTAFVQAAIAAAASSGAGEWGSITGTLGDQEDLADALALKAPLDSPTFTGVPAAVTADAGTNTTQLATTAFVQTAIGNLISSAPSALDTLNELAAALGDDADFASTVTNALVLKAPLASPTFTGTVIAPTVSTASDSSTKIATTAFVQAAIGVAAISESQVTNLSSDLAAKAPLASPAFTGTVIAPTVSTATDSSTNVATTAFVQSALAAYTAPITNDGSGHYIFGGSDPLDLGDGASPATLSVYGGVAISAAVQNRMINTATSLTELQNQNVMSWEHTNADGAAAVSPIANVGTIIAGLTLTKKAYVGCFAFQNYTSSSTSWRYNGYMAMGASMPYYTDGSNVPPTQAMNGHALKAPPLGLFRESSYTPPGGSSDNNWHVVPQLDFTADWEIYFRDYDDRALVYIPRSNVNGNQNFYFYQTAASANGSGTGCQILMTTADGTPVHTILSAISANQSYRAYPTSGGWVGCDGSGGFMVGATHASGILKFVVGGDDTSNVAAKFDASKNFILNNKVTSAPSATLANGECQVCVYDNSGTAVFRVRYKDGSGTVKTGDLALS